MRSTLFREGWLCGYAVPSGRFRPQQHKYRNGATMRRWEEEWASTIDSEWTRRLIPKLDQWINITHGEVDYHITQFLTDHEGFGSYLYRFKIRPTPECVDCPALVDDPEHAILACPRWAPAFSILETALSNKLTPDNIVSNMLRSPTAWKLIANHIRSTLTTREAEERDR